MKVSRRQGGNDLSARFKADMSSKLFYVGKGFERGEADRFTANVSLNYLDASQTAQHRQNYNRLTGSLRLKQSWEGHGRYRYALGGSLDYTGSFDNEKSDENLDNGNVPLERYKSSYNRMALSATSVWRPRRPVSSVRWTPLCRPRLRMTLLTVGNTLP